MQRMDSVKDHRIDSISPILLTLSERIGIGAGLVCTEELTINTNHVVVKLDEDCERTSSNTLRITRQVVRIIRSGSTSTCLHPSSVNHVRCTYIALITTPA